MSANSAVPCATHTRGRFALSGSNYALQQATALFGVEPLKGFVKEFDRVRLLLGHNNWLWALAPEIQRGPVKVWMGVPM